MPNDSQYITDEITSDVEIGDDYPESAEEEAGKVADPLWVMSVAAAPNIAELLDGEELGKIGSKVRREYDIDKNSRSEWEKEIDKAMDLALQVKKDKTWPWPNAANQKFPVLTTASIQFAARAYPAIVDASGVVKGKVNGSDEGMPVIDPRNGQPVITPEGEPFWQIPPGIKRDRADRVASHMSWQLLEEMPEWEPDTDRMLHVLPITGVAFRKTWFDPTEGRNRSEMVPPKHVVINYDAPSMEKAPRITHEFELYPHEITERVRSGLFVKNSYGLARNANGDEDAPHEFLEQHRLLDLDEDGYPEPYIVTIHKATSQVARIVARFEIEDVLVNEAGEIVRIEPNHAWTKYGFIPNPESAIYDLGFGALLMSVGDGINTILNQLLDAGTIQNAGGGFIGTDLRIKGGAMRFTPGEYKPVDATGQKIADSIYHMQHAGPSPVLFQLLGLLIDSAENITSVKDILTGSEQSNAPATTTLALIEQGMKAFSAIFKRIHRSLKAELKKLYRLNRLYLDQEVYFTFLDKAGRVTLQDYEDDSLDITPVSDPTIVTDMQKLGRAQFLMQFSGDPFFNQMEIRRRLLTAASIDGVDQLLIEPKPQPDPAMIKEERETARIGAELALKKEKQDVDIAAQGVDMVQKLATAVDKLERKAGDSLDQESIFYLEQMRVIADELQRGNDGGGLPPMAGPPGDPGIQAIPAGPPPNAEGGASLDLGVPGGLPGQPGPGV